MDIPSIPSNLYIFEFITKSPLSHCLIKNEYNDNSFILDMSNIERYYTNVDRYFEVRYVHLDFIKKTITSIILRDNIVVTSENKKEWDIAKIHLIATTNLYFPALLHNFVHFHFPDAGTAIAYNLFPKNLVSF